MVLVNGIAAHQDRYLVPQLDQDHHRVGQPAVSGDDIVAAELHRGSYVPLEALLIPGLDHGRPAENPRYHHRVTQGITGVLEPSVHWDICHVRRQCGKLFQEDYRVQTYHRPGDITADLVKEMEVISNLSV